MNDFQEQILDNYKHPKNFGLPTWSASKSQKAQNISCGDEVEIFVLLENEIVKDMRFIGQGCSISIASASLLTQEFIGKNVNYIKEFSYENLLRLLGIPLTTSRQVCATLPLEAIQAAL